MMKEADEFQTKQKKISDISYVNKLLSGSLKKKQK